MKRDYGDMYQYILESKKAVRNIISNHEEIFHDAIEYFFNGNYEQIYVIGSGTSYHAALAAKNLMEKVLQMKFLSAPSNVKVKFISQAVISKWQRTILFLLLLQDAISAVS